MRKTYCFVTHEMENLSLYFYFPSLILHCIKFKALNTPKYKIIPFLHMGNMNVCNSKMNTHRLRR